MVDFYTATAANRAARRALAARLAAKTIPAATVTRLSDALTAAPALADLGALVDHWVRHAAGDSDRELDLLEQATALWRRFRALSDRFDTERADFELLVTDPLQQARVSRAQALAARLKSLLAEVGEWLNEAAEFLQDNLGKLDYLTPVGQAGDTAPSTWSPADIVSSRCTGAFRSALLDTAFAGGDPAAISFAYGAVAGYAGHLCGSAYLTGIVGGPRRSHPYRYRLSANCAGAWLRRYRPQDTAELTALAQEIRDNLATPSVRSAMDTALTTYAGALPALDLTDAGDKLARHLELLDELRLFDGGPTSAVPAPSPVIDVVVTIMQERGIAPASAGSPAPASGTGSFFGPTPPGPTPPQSKATSKKNAPIWKTILATVLTILFGLAGGVVGFLLGGPAGAAAGASFGASGGAALGELLGLWDTPDAEDPPAGSVAAAVTVSLDSDDALQACFALLELHELFFDAGQQFLFVLKVAGLAYPEDPDLAHPLISPLLIQTEDTFPFHQPESDPDRFTRYPATPLEKPTRADHFPYHFGHTPAVVLSGTPVDPAGTGAETMALGMWLDEETGAGTDIRRVDRHLDSDIGFLEPCWEGKVTPDPIDITPLPYGAVHN